jgi:hypothetical protein
MRWTAAYSKYGSAQVNPAYLTILSSGVTPVSTGHELGAYVTQYNATTSNVVQEPVKGYTAEGDIDASITGCLTNNQVLLAGSGCFVPSKPLYITMLRITSSDSVSTATIYSALTFAINNQALRHAPGPVSLSYGTSYPDAPLWSDSGIQSLAGSLLNQGDILVVAAGDTPGTYTNYPPGNVVVAQGTNINNQFDSSQLTLVANDPVGAPGAQQPAVINGEYSDNYYGSSFSAPLWASAISMLISVSPSLTSAQAHQILLNTGTNIKGSSWPAVVPAFDAGIQSATSQ